MPPASELLGYGAIAVAGAMAVAVATAVGRSLKWCANFFAKSLSVHLVLQLGDSPAVQELIRNAVSDQLDARPLTNGKGWVVMQAIMAHIGLEIDEVFPESIPPPVVKSQ